MDEEFPELTSGEEILIGAFNRFMGFFARKLVAQTSNETSREYPFVAMDTRQVFQELTLVAKYLQEKKGKDLSCVRFVDVGCGFGNVMLLAEQFGFQVFGIEKDEASLKVASEFFHHQQLIKEDLRFFNGYDSFDVVYYFCPLTTGQREFEESLEDAISPGTILIANYKRSKAIESDMRFRKLSRQLPVWEKLS